MRAFWAGLAMYAVGAGTFGAYFVTTGEPLIVGGWGLSLMFLGILAMRPKNEP